MHKPWPTLIAMSALVLAPLGWHAPLLAQASATVTPVQARVIVKFKAESTLLRKQAQSATATSSRERAASLGERVGRVLTAGSAVSDRAQVVSAQGVSSDELARSLAAQSDVEYAVPDQRRHRFAVPNDTRYESFPLTGAGSGGPVSGQWYLRAPTATVRSAINAEGAWDTSTGSPSVVVAVLDTGIRADHADLAANLLPGYDMVSADGANKFLSANDHDGRDADPADPGDWIDDKDTDPLFADCDPEPSSWHGTQTAGLIGALTDNSLGMASVGRTVRVLPVRVLGKCGGYDSDIIAGMRWAAGLHVDGVPENTTQAKVINMSLGGDGACSQSYKDAMVEIAARGTVVVASAGNSAGHAVSSPANCPGVIAVTGLRHIGSKVGFADVGSEVTIAAPGGNCVNTASTAPCVYPILTTTNAGTTTPVASSSIYTDAFNASLGTSFSAPLVAGTVGLMLSAQPSMTPTDVRATLQGSARSFPDSGADAGVAACHAPNGVDQLECYCTTSTCGAGMLDAKTAVEGAARGLQARVTLSSETPAATQALTLSASNSFVLSPRTPSTYQWTLVDDGGIVTPATFTSSGDSATATPSGAGRFVVRLSVTDSSGAQSTTDRAIDVSAPPIPPTPIRASEDSGGGALGPVWLVLLLAAVVTLRRQSRRPA
ncbi:MAG TPA: S8 family serine peptidase [Rhizobacter sp.]|nr:S8 family serine peptidase [Rhizobacter sp.]